MNALFSAEDLDFRMGLRSFFSTQIPQRIRDKVSAGQQLEKADYVESQRILNANGLAVPHWPEQWGGRGWTPLQR